MQLAMFIFDVYQKTFINKLILKELQKNAWEAMLDGLNDDLKIFFNFIFWSLVVECGRTYYENAMHLST